MTENTNQTNQEPVQDQKIDMFADMMKELEEEQASQSSLDSESPEPTEGVKAQNDIQSKKTLESEKKDEQKNDKETINYKEKYEKAETFSQENMKYARSVNQKLKETLKVIDKLVEDADIDEETAGKLFEILKKDSINMPEDNFSNKAKESEEESKHPLSKYKKMLDRDVFQTYVEFSEDDHAIKKLKAFDQFVIEANDDEILELDKELSQLKTPMSVLKKIISVGDTFLKEGLDDFYSQGGFRKYLSSHKSEIEKRDKEIDKLNKKLSQYTSHESSGNFWLGDSSKGSSNDGNLKETGDMYKDMIAEEKLEKRRSRR